jgi:hypothetical protein
MIAKLIEIKNVLERSRKAAKSILGEMYNESISDWIEQLKKSAIDLDTTELNALLVISDSETYKNDGMMQLMLTAALCEILNPIE